MSPLLTTLNSSNVFLHFFFLLYLIIHTSIIHYRVLISFFKFKKKKQKTNKQKILLSGNSLTLKLYRTMFWGAWGLLAVRILVNSSFSSWNGTHISFFYKWYNFGNSLHCKEHMYVFPFLLSTGSLLNVRVNATFHL